MLFLTHCSKLSVTHLLISPLQPLLVPVYFCFCFFLSRGGMHLYIALSLWTVSEGASGYDTNSDTKTILLYGSAFVLEGLYIQRKKKGRS